MTRSRQPRVMIDRRRLLAGSGAIAASVFSGAAMPTGAGRVVYAQDGGKEFHGAMPFTDPGAGGHFNSYAVDGILNPPNIYGFLTYVPLGLMYWATMSWMPLVAEKWQYIKRGSDGASPAATPAAAASPAVTPQGFVMEPYAADCDTLRIWIRKGVTWSDGGEVSAKDVVDTFDVQRLMGDTMFDYVNHLEAVDDHTVDVLMKKPSTVVERYIIRFGIRPSSVYGEWAGKARDMIASGKDRDSQEWKRLVEEFSKFHPEKPVGTGPYLVDPNSITTAELRMTKNDTSYWAKQAKFDSMVLYNGETDTVSPIVLAKDIDYATHGFPPATEKAMVDAGIRVLRPPTYGGTSILLNYKALKHFSDKRVRQALAHAIDRSQVGMAALAKSGVPIKHMSGMSDLLVDQWLDDETKSKLNPYEYDPEKAAALLTEAGWKKNGESWSDPDGKPARIEFTDITEWQDASAAALSIMDQLRVFGFDMVQRPISYTQRETDLNEGKFQMILGSYGNGASPHPHYSYVTAFFTYNARTEGTTERGQDFPLVQKTDAAGDVNIDELVIACAEGMDTEKQRVTIQKMALIYNELLNQLPMYERYGNNPGLEGVRVKAWPADDDPMMKQSYYADGLPTMLMLSGRLEPV